MELPLATGFYEDASKPIAAQQCANWIPQVPQTNAQSKAQLIGSPGTSLFATAGTIAARGEHVMNSIAYTVNGNTLYRVNADKTTTDLGAITGAGKVSMADNGTQLCIVVPRSTGYIYTVAGGLVTITDTDYTTTLGPSEQVVFKDGYFIHYNNTAPGLGPIFFITNLNNGLVIDPLDFGTAEADPDEITGLHVNRNQLNVGGRQTLEPFSNIGGVGFPFQRIPGAIIQKGVRAKFSLIDFDNSFVYVGGGENEKPAIWKSTGSGAVKISTASIDNIIQQSTDAEIEGIFATTYSENGEFFANFHLNDRVFSYCAAASVFQGKPVWLERKSKDSFGQLTTWRVAGIIEAYGETLVTDNQSGNIGVLGLSTYTEYGATINRVVSTQPFDIQSNEFIVTEMELTCESGVGNIVDPGADPKITRSFSDDGGFTFGNEIPRPLGKQGEHKQRQVWSREGLVNKARVYKFTHDAPVKAVIIKLEADIAA